MPEILFKEKPFRTLVSLSDNSKIWYANALCKETDTTYPHMLKILKELETVGLISTENIGRIKTIRLTKNGIRLADLLSEANKITAPEQESVRISNNVLESVNDESKKSDS